MKKEKHLFCVGRGLRSGFLCLMVSALLLLGISCTKDGTDPSDSMESAMESAMDNGTVADSHIGSVTSPDTEKHTTPGTQRPDTERVTTSVTEQITERVTTPETSAVTLPAPNITGKARGGK